MAITTFDQVQAGLQPAQPFVKTAQTFGVNARPCSFWTYGGWPRAGTYPGTLAGATLSSTTSQVVGQIPYYHPGGGLRSYLARFSATCDQGGMLIVADRLWHNGGMTITSATAQTINSPTLPARDNAGTSNGDGVLAMVEVSSAVGTASPTLTIEYTNQAGTTGRTATNLLGTGNTSQIGPSWMLGLQAGDTGIQSIQTYTQSVSWVSGTVNLVLYRPLLFLEVKLPRVPAVVDFLTSGGVRLYEGTVPYLIFIPNISGGSGIQGSIQYTFG